MSCPFNSFKFKELSSFLCKYVANVQDGWTILARTRTQPIVPTVYCLFDSRTNKIWYIGHSKNLMRRILQHKANPRIAKAPWDTVAHLEPGISAESVRLEVEGHLQLIVRPPLCQLISLRLCANGHLK
ncbi:unnamed protein product, partial [marine sediment metagenome]